MTEEELKNIGYYFSETPLADIPSKTSVPDNREHIVLKGADGVPVGVVFGDGVTQLRNLNLVLSVEYYLKSLPGYAEGTVLKATATGFEWGVVSSTEPEPTGDTYADTGYVETGYSE